MQVQVFNSEEFDSRPILNGNEIKLIGTMAEDIQSIFAVKRGIALSQAIDLVGSNCNLNFNSLKQLLPPAKHDDRFKPCACPVQRDFPS